MHDDDRMIMYQFADGQWSAIPDPVDWDSEGPLDPLVKAGYIPTLQWGPEDDPVITLMHGRGGWRAEVSLTGNTDMHVYMPTLQDALEFVRRYAPAAAGATVPERRDKAVRDYVSTLGGKGRS